MGDQASFHVSIARENSALSRTQSVCSIHGSRSITRGKSLNQPSTVEDEGEPQKERFNKSFHGYRYVIVIMAGLSVGLMMLLRLNITVAIIKMVNQTQIYLEEHPDDADLIEYFGEDYVEEGEFEWNNERQQLIISYYMITYTVSRLITLFEIYSSRGILTVTPQLPQFFATRLSLIIGSRLAIPISLLICVISTLLIPIVAYWGWEWVLVMRLINGLGATAVLPTQLNLLEKWVPKQDLTLGLTIAVMVQGIINSVGPFITGYLASFHWTYAFYGQALIVLVFCVLWLILVSDSPSDNWFISEKEMNMICNCADHNDIEKSSECSGERSAQNVEKAGGNQEKSVTLLDIFRVPIFYVYILIWSLYCGAINCYTFALSNYLRQYLKIKISMNGLYISIITAGSLVSIVWPHPVLKILQSKLKVSVVGSRCLAIAVTCTLTAATWTYVGLFHDNQLLVFFLHRCFMQSQDVIITASLMNNFTGLSSIVYSVMNTFGNASALPGAALIGYVLDYTGQSDLAWTWIFISLAITQLIIILLYCGFIHANPIQISRDRPVKKAIKEKSPEYTVK